MIAVPSPNFDTRPGPVNALVMHYTGMTGAQAALQRLTDPAAKVSSHYLIDDDGAVYVLVEESQRAWHAGISYWRGVSDLNDGSIGIEIVNPGHEWGYQPYPPVQMQALVELCQGILGRHDIPARNIVGHSDIAPNRKQDPGELFDWQALAGAGIGLWTEASGDAGDVSADLAAIGYDIRLPVGDVILAFQRRFMPQHLTGVADELTARRVAAIRDLFA